MSCAASASTNSSSLPLGYVVEVLDANNLRDSLRHG